MKIPESEPVKMADEKAESSSPSTSSSVQSTGAGSSPCCEKGAATVAMPVPAASTTTASSSPASTITSSSSSSDNASVNSGSGGSPVPSPVAPAPPLSNGGGVTTNGGGSGEISLDVGMGDMAQNGHLSPVDGVGLVAVGVGVGVGVTTNGLAHSQNSSPSPQPAVCPQTVTHTYMEHTQEITVTQGIVGQMPNTNHHGVGGGGMNSPNNLGHRPSSSSQTTNHRGSSPNQYSPNPQSRGSSPNSQNSPPGGQGQPHVVHVHVNPGETFSVRVGDQIQHIQGPATVRMVSNNGPPLPMPMQVPPGHMVQQIVDENGILTHVILSPQPPGMPGPPMTVGYYGGPNGTPQQMYPTYGPQYPPYATQYTPPHHHAHHGAPPHMHPVAPPHMHGTPPPHQCTGHSHQHVQPSAGPPPSSQTQTQPHNQTPVDERAQRQKQRLQGKLIKRHREGYYQNHVPDSPGRSSSKAKLNGDIRRSDQHSSSSSVDGQDLEEDRRIYVGDILSKLQLPKVSEIEARSALIQLIPPDLCQHQDQDLEVIDPSQLKYELLLSEKGKEGKYKLVYNGDATVITLKDLKPATEYHLKVSCLLDDIKGDLTEPVSFKTQCCEPDPPQPPKLSTRTKTSLFLKWNATQDNGAKISSYTLEYDQLSFQGRGDMDFVEIYNGLQRQYKVTKLSASMGYTFRLAAINSVGKSEFSEIVCYFTSGSVPSQPDPPMLSEPFVKALTISWIKRPNDDEFLLQMDDEATGHGFLTVYNGPDLSYKIKNLRRNSEYKYRLQANNEEGNSKWSDVMNFRTLPDKPGMPNKPQIKGKVHSHSFRVIWDPPKDTGGTEITRCILEIDSGRGYEEVYEGVEREFACDHLEPGHQYKVRLCCEGAGGQSDWSESQSVCTQSVPPGICSAPKLQGKPKATSSHLRWVYPAYDGGSPVTEFEALLTNPDNTTREVYRGRDLDCSVAGLLPGRPYLFQVRAINKAGAGPWSEILEVISGPGVPDPPRVPAVHCRSPHSAIISWEEPVNNGARITDYRLEWQHRGEGEFKELSTGPALNFEVKGLTPATMYSFRVQALNSAGAGPFCATASCVMPRSSPGAVNSLRASTTATSIHLTWKEPLNNGSDVVSYNIDIGEKHLISVGNIMEYVIPDLVPETTYKLRVQAVNGIGVGAFSSPVKVTTRPLPPSPPHLECVSCGPNSLKLKWGDGKNPDLIQYCLEMLRDNGSFHPVYHGSGHTHKVNKLAEMTEYEFRIYASNQAGNGSYSDVSKFKTTKAPPPAVKAPKVSDISLDSCVVEWPAAKPMGKDSIIYILQLMNTEDRDQQYTQIYRGPDNSYRISGSTLRCKVQYQVRVCAVRQCCDDGNSIAELVGAFSPRVTFVMASPSRPIPLAAGGVGGTSAAAIIPERRQLTDQQWAFIILLAFTVLAVLVAFGTQQIIAYTNGGSGGTTANALGETTDDATLSELNDTTNSSTQ